MSLSRIYLAEPFHKQFIVKRENAEAEQRLAVSDKASLFNRLPPEIYSHIYRFLTPEDIYSLSACCRALHEVAQDDLLWQQIYTLVYDQYTYPDIHQYQLECRQRSIALALAVSSDEEKKLRHFEVTARSLLAIAESASPISPSKNSEILKALFINKKAERFYLDRELSITSSGPITRSSTSRASHHKLDHWFSAEARSLSARLHIINGLTTKELASSASSQHIRGQARASAYNHKTYRDNNFTPFLPHTKLIDYNLMENLQTVWRMNALDQQRFWREQDGWSQKLTGGWIDEMLPSPPNVKIRDNKRDWARVEQKWVGSYAFLDYVWFYYGKDFMDVQMDLSDLSEATGDLMQLDLKLVESPTAGHSDSHPDCPTLFFRGISRTAGHVSSMRGQVELGPQGFPLWKFVVSYDRWHLTGVEMCETGGVLGVWSDATQEEESPIGPFFFTRQ